MKKIKPRDFWKRFKRSSHDYKGDDIDLDSFFNHFKNLYSNIATNEDIECQDFIHSFDESDYNEPIFQELDEPFTILEIRNCVKGLGSNKACSTDNTIYEYFTACIDYLDKPFLSLFNHILKQVYPKTWSRGVIIPVYKKGDSSDPNNYRGITLTSCFSKLFTSLINEPLKAWLKKYDVISDAQFGFKSNFSTTDAIFILNTFIQKQFQEKKPLFCCFIDLQKCFDSIYRNGLWCKLIKQGINGKLFSVIRTLYDEVKLCVKHMNSVSDLYNCKVGLLQGETISPILFSLFVNDIELFLQLNTSHAFTFDQLTIFLLLFADDSVLISDSAEGLESLIIAFEKYCIKWKLTVNVEKTKIVIFKKHNRNNELPVFKNMNKNIEKVKTFNYLGIVFTSNGTFHNAIKTLTGKATQAVSNLFTITQNKEIPIKTMIGLFDAFVA